MNANSESRVESVALDDARSSRVVSVADDFCYSPGMLSVEAAQSIMLSNARPFTAVERVPLGEAVGRVLAEAVRAPIDVPGYDNSQMDGYAVRSMDLDAQARNRLRVSQRIAAGGVVEPLMVGTAARIFTGAPMPPGADAVIAQEDCERDGDWVTLGPVNAGENVRPRGNDIRSGDEILDKGTIVRAQEIGVLASLGLADVAVMKRPVVAILSNGDELRMPGEPLGYGEIYNSNRFVLQALAHGMHCEVIDCGIVGDTLAAAIDALSAAASGADLVVSSGGMSVGEEDHIKAALEAIGSLDMWKVAVKPGKPLAYGRIGQSDFVGLPGNPVSALVTYCLFVRPFLRKRLGARQLFAEHFEVRADFEWSRAGRRREFARARLEYSRAHGPSAVLHPRQGSDVLSSTSWADGLVMIPEGRCVRAGDRVRYLPFVALLG